MNATANYAASSVQSASHDQFAVWIRPLANRWKVRVEDETNVYYLRKKLTRMGFHCSAIRFLQASGMYVFFVEPPTKGSHQKLEMLLDKMSCVDLMLAPA